MLSFHVKFVQTDRRTDGRTTVKQYAPDLSIRGHKNIQEACDTEFLIVNSSLSAGIHNTHSRTLYYAFRGQQPKHCAIRDALCVLKVGHQTMPSMTKNLGTVLLGTHNTLT